MLFPALKILEVENLLHLTFDVWDKTRIDNYHILGRLREEYVYQPKGNNIENHYSTNEPSSHDNNIELTLTASDNQFHPDCPPFSTTFNLKESVILKPGEEYACNLYNKPNGDVSITINLVEKMEQLPTHVRLESLPIELKKQVEDYLRNNEKGDA